MTTVEALRETLAALTDLVRQIPGGALADYQLDRAEVASLRAEEALAHAEREASAVENVIAAATIRMNDDIGTWWSDASDIDVLAARLDSLCLAEVVALRALAATRRA